MGERHGSGSGGVGEHGTLFLLHPKAVVHETSGHAASEADVHRLGESAEGETGLASFVVAFEVWTAVHRHRITGGHASILHIAGGGPGSMGSRPVQFGIELERVVADCGLHARRSFAGVLIEPCSARDAVPVIARDPCGSFRPSSESSDEPSHSGQIQAARKPWNGARTDPRHHACGISGGSVPPARRLDRHLRPRSFDARRRNRGEFAP